MSRIVPDILKHYRVKPEFAFEWGDDPDLVINSEQAADFARDSETTIEKILSEFQELPPDWEREEDYPF